MEIKEASFRGDSNSLSLVQEILLHEARVDEMLREVALDGDFRDEATHCLLLMVKTRLEHIEQLEAAAIAEFRKAERIYGILEGEDRDTGEKKVQRKMIEPPLGMSGKRGVRKKSPYTNPKMIVSHHITNGNALMNIAMRCRCEVSLLVLGRFILPLH